MKKSAEITIAVKLYYLMKKTKLKYHHEEKSTKFICDIRTCCFFTQKKGDFYCPNCFYLFRSANMVNSHEKVYRNYNCCQIVLPDEEKKSSCGKINKITIFDICTRLIFNQRKRRFFSVQIPSTFSEVQIRLIRIKKSTKNLIVIKLYYLMKKKTLKYHHGENSTKLPYAMYVQNLHPKKQIINVLIFMHDESQNKYFFHGRKF